MNEIRLTPSQATSAQVIQRLIDTLGPEGGRVILPAMDLTLDRGLELRSGVELVGQGEKTILRKGPGRTYRLTGYHNFGMRDVPLVETDGLEVGMTVSVEDEKHRGFMGTFARITWIDAGWVGLDRGLAMDYAADASPVLSLAYPLVFGHGIVKAALRDVTLEGNRADNPYSMNGCRGGAVYFAKSANIEVTGVQERDYSGEGLSFQMCANVTIRNCAFSQNTGNGLHPGAGSTQVRFQDCVAHENEQSGFFFCVRANHITVADCTFLNNKRFGVSMGTRDCHNLLSHCRMEGNRLAGVYVRPGPKPVEVHACAVQDCDIKGNATHEGKAQIEIHAEAHDVLLEANRISAPDAGAKTGIHVAPEAKSVFCDRNEFTGTEPDLDANAASLACERPCFTCGQSDLTAKAFRHLPPPAGPGRAS